MWDGLAATLLAPAGEGGAHQPRAMLPRYCPGIEDHENDLVGWP